VDNAFRAGKRPDIPADTVREYFERAGFGQVEVHRLPHDMQNDYWVLRH